MKDQGKTAAVLAGYSCQLGATALYWTISDHHRRLSNQLKSFQVVRLSKIKAPAPLARAAILTWRLRTTRALMALLSFTVRHCPPGSSLTCTSISGCSAALIMALFALPCTQAARQGVGQEQAPFQVAFFLRSSGPLSCTPIFAQLCMLRSVQCVLGAGIADLPSHCCRPAMAGGATIHRPPHSVPPVLLQFEPSLDSMRIQPSALWVPPEYPSSCCCPVSWLMYG